VYEDVEDPAAFRVESEWSDVPALEQHLRSHSFGALLGAFELLAEPPRLVVNAALEPYGGDPAGAIRKLREGRSQPAER
jgi:quinol monooxygenase YgiN